MAAAGQVAEEAAKARERAVAVSRGAEAAGMATAAVKRAAAVVVERVMAVRLAAEERAAGGQSTVGIPCRRRS